MPRTRIGFEGEEPTSWRRDRMRGPAGIRRTPPPRSPAQDPSAQPTLAGRGGTGRHIDRSHGFEGGARRRPPPERDGQAAGPGRPSSAGGRGAGRRADRTPRGGGATTPPGRAGEADGADGRGSRTSFPRWQRRDGSPGLMARARRRAGPGARRRHGPAGRAGRTTTEDPHNPPHASGADRIVEPFGRIARAHLGGAGPLGAGHDLPSGQAGGTARQRRPMAPGGRAGRADVAGGAGMTLPRQAGADGPQAHGSDAPLPRGAGEGGTDRRAGGSPWDRRRSTPCPSRR